MFHFESEKTTCSGVSYWNPVINHLLDEWSGVWHDLIKMGFFVLWSHCSIRCTSNPDDLVPIIKNIIIWHISLKNLLILKPILAMWVEINHDIRIFSDIDLVPKINLIYFCWFLIEVFLKFTDAIPIKGPSMCNVQLSSLKTKGFNYL